MKQQFFFPFHIQGTCKHTQQQHLPHICLQMLLIFNLYGNIALAVFCINFLTVFVANRCSVDLFCFVYISSRGFIIMLLYLHVFFLYCVFQICLAIIFPQENTSLGVDSILSELLVLDFLHSLYYKVMLFFHRFIYMSVVTETSTKPRQKQNHHMVT